MKKFFILGLLIFSLVLTGCNNLESKEDSETDKIVQKPIPNKIFDRKIINSRISENELKKSIKMKSSQKLANTMRTKLILKNL